MRYAFGWTGTGGVELPLIILRLDDTSQLSLASLFFHPVDAVVQPGKVMQTLV
jgi:hypothetical protein